MNNDDVIEYIKKSVDLIVKYREVFLNIEKDDDKIDISGQIVEVLNIFLKYIRDRIDDGSIIKDNKVNNIKDETMLFKEYLINYIDGMLNTNDYIIDKYNRCIRVSFDVWIEDVESVFLH